MKLLLMMTKYLLDRVTLLLCYNNILLHIYLYKLMIDLVYSTNHYYSSSKYLMIELLMYYIYLHHKEYIASLPITKLKSYIYQRCILLLFLLSNSILPRIHLYMPMIDLVYSTNHYYNSSKYLMIELLMYYIYLHHKEYIASLLIESLKSYIYQRCILLEHHLQYSNGQSHNYHKYLH